MKINMGFEMFKKREEIFPQEKLDILLADPDFKELYEAYLLAAGATQGTEVSHEEFKASSDKLFLVQRWLDSKGFKFTENAIEQAVEEHVGGFPEPMPGPSDPI